MLWSHHLNTAPRKYSIFFKLQRHPMLKRFIRLFATHCFEIRINKLLFIFLQKTHGLHRIGWESRRRVTVDGWLARLRELLNQFFPNSSQFQHLADAMERNGQPPRDMVAMFLIYFVLSFFLPDELVWFQLETLVSMIMISTRAPLAND